MSNNPVALPLNTWVYIETTKDESKRHKALVKAHHDEGFWAEVHAPNYLKDAGLGGRNAETVPSAVFFPWSNVVSVEVVQ